MWMNHFAIWRRVVGRYWKKRKKWLRLGRLTKRKINFKLCIVPIDRCGRLCFLIITTVSPTLPICLEGDLSLFPLRIKVFIFSPCIWVEVMTALTNGEQQDWCYVTTELGNINYKRAMWLENLPWGSPS